MPESREDDYRNNTFSLNDLYGYAAAHESLHRGHEMYIFIEFLCHNYYIIDMDNVIDQVPV